MPDHEPITKAVIERLIEAMARSFGACTCQTCAVHGQHQCAGCEFLSERDTLCLRADKLNFYRWDRQRLLREEGLLQPSPVIATNTLPW